MQGKVEIPKKAVKPLIEHCAKLSEETGKPADEIFKNYLELMNKHADYFSARPWPETRQVKPRLKREDLEFIKGAGSHEERLERFTLVCLRGNISLEGFNSELFRENFASYGGRECHDCSVPEAMELRKYVELVEQQRREIEEDLKRKNPSWLSKSTSEHNKRPDVVKAFKMVRVELRLYEEIGAKGKSCDVKNKYKCPYRELSENLIKNGRRVDALWGHIRWYDRHWNCPKGSYASGEDAKWYHCDEPSLMDVTSYEDIRKAIRDGTLKKIIKEHKKYVKETGTPMWAL